MSTYLVLDTLTCTIIAGFITAIGLIWSYFNHLNRCHYEAHAGASLTHRWLLEESEQHTPWAWSMLAAGISIDLALLLHAISQRNWLYTVLQIAFSLGLILGGIAWLKANHTTITRLNKEISPLEKIQGIGKHADARAEEVARLRRLVALSMRMRCVPSILILCGIWFAVCFILETFR